MIDFKKLEGHTPGPWSTHECSHGGIILLRGDADAPPATRHPQSHLQIVPEVDGYLMEAAPELLELVKEYKAIAQEVVKMIEATFTFPVRQEVPNWFDIHDTLVRLAKKS